MILSISIVWNNFQASARHHFRKLTFRRYLNSLWLGLFVPLGLYLYDYPWAAAIIGFGIVSGLLISSFNAIWNRRPQSLYAETPIEEGPHLPFEVWSLIFKFTRPKDAILPPVALRRVCKQWKSIYDGLLTRENFKEYEVGLDEASTYELVIQPSVTLEPNKIYLSLNQRKELTYALLDPKGDVKRGILKTFSFDDSNPLSLDTLNHNWVFYELSEIINPSLYWNLQQKEIEHFLNPTNRNASIDQTCKSHLLRLKEINQARDKNGFYFKEAENHLEVVSYALVHPLLISAIKYNRLLNLKDLTLESKRITRLPSLSFTLPQHRTLWTNLTYLSLSNNQLARLPPAIGGLKALRLLDVSHNYLRKLPPEIGELNALGFLQLNNNLLIILPAAVGKLTALQQLHLESNPLQHLPVEIGQLPKLEQIYLYNNQLQSIPHELKEEVLYNYSEVTGSFVRTTKAAILKTQCSSDKSAKEKSLCRIC